MRGVARTAAVVGTATAVSGRVSHRQANRWAAQDQPQSASQPPPPPAPVDQPEYAPPVAAAEPPPDDTNDKLDQLTQLGALKEQCILTEAEFEAQKSKILAG